MYAHVEWCRASDCSGAALSPPNSGDCRTCTQIAAPTSQHSLEYVVCGRILGRRGEPPPVLRFSLARRARLREDVRACRMVPSKRLLWRSPISAGFRRLSDCTHIATFLRVRGLWANLRPSRGAPPVLRFSLARRVRRGLWTSPPRPSRGSPPVLRFSLARRARLREDVRACRLVPSKRLLWRSPISAEFRRLSDCTHIATFLRVRGLWANRILGRRGESLRFSLARRARLRDVFLLMYAHVGWCRASDCSGAALSPPDSGDCRTAPTSQHSLEYVVCGRIFGRRGESLRFSLARRVRLREDVRACRTLPYAGSLSDGVFFVCVPGDERGPSACVCQSFP